MRRKDKRPTNALSTSIPASPSPQTDQIRGVERFKSLPPRPNRGLLMAQCSVLDLRKDSSLFEMPQAPLDSTLFYSPLSEYEFHLEERGKVQSLRDRIVPPAESAREIINCITSRPDMLTRQFCENPNPYSTSGVSKGSSSNKRIEKLLKDLELEKKKVGRTVRFLSVGENTEAIWKAIEKNIPAEHLRANYLKSFVAACLKYIQELVYSADRLQLTLSSNAQKELVKLKQFIEDPAKVVLSPIAASKPVIQMMNTVWKDSAIQETHKLCVGNSQDMNTFQYLLDNCGDIFSDKLVVGPNHFHMLQVISKGLVRSIMIKNGANSSFKFCGIDRITGAVRGVLDLFADGVEVLGFFADISSAESAKNSYALFQIVLDVVTIQNIILIFSGGQQLDQLAQSQPEILESFSMKESDKTVSVSKFVQARFDKKIKDQKNIKNMLVNTFFLEADTEYSALLEAFLSMGTAVIQKQLQDEVFHITA